MNNLSFSEKAFTSKAFKKFSGRTHGPHNFTLLDVFFSQSDEKRTLADFQNMKISIFKTPSKEKLYADFPKMQHDVFVWKYRESFLPAE